MNSVAAALKKISAVKVTVIGGPNSGQSFVFDRQLITIGRGSDNDIVFAQDTRMSRNHLELQKVGDKLIVRNISQRNQILLNNERVQEKAISGTSIIQVGGTNLEIRLASDEGLNSPQKAVAKLVAVPVAQVQKLEVEGRSSSPPPPSQKISSKTNSAKFEARASSGYSEVRTQPQKNSRARLYVIVALVIMAGAWLLNDDAKKKKMEINIRTEADITRAIDDSAKAVKEIQASQSRMGQDSIQFKAAQEQYVKGFRDYRQGQYARAQQSFQAALSLYPAHELARKYYVQAQRKFEEQVDTTMSQGRKYYQKNNYRMCQSAFASAMIMIKDTTKAKYKEAKQLYDECSLRLEGRF